jgi:hypothetical protein
MKNSFSLVLVLFLMISCSEKKPTPDPKVLMDADSAFHGQQRRVGLYPMASGCSLQKMILLAENT